MKALKKISQGNLRISHQSEVLTLRRQMQEMQDKFDLLLNASTDIKHQSDRLTIRVGGGYKIIESKEVLYCQAQSNYTLVYFVSGEKILIAKTLKKLSLEWDSIGFLRSHQSYFINKMHVCGYSNEKGLHIKLINGTSIPVSRRNKKEVLMSIG